MISRDDILSLNFYKYGNPFTGSYKGMRYRIIQQKEKKDDDGNVIAEHALVAVIWPEPFSFEHTDDEKKTEKKFPFSDEGMDELLAWINASWPDYQNR